MEHQEPLKNSEENSYKFQIHISDRNSLEIRIFLLNKHWRSNSRKFTFVAVCPKPGTNHDHRH